MTLSRKTVLIIVTTFAALLIIIAASADIILLKSFAEAENKVLRESMEKFRSELNETFDELEICSLEYAQTVSRLYSSDKSVSDFVTTLNINSFVNHRVDLIALGDRNGSIIAYQLTDFHKSSPMPFPKELIDKLKPAFQLAGKSSGKEFYGIVLMGNLPLLFSATPLNGNSGVLLIAGRLLDNAELHRLSMVTKLSPEMTPLGAAPLSADFAAAFKALSAGTPFYAQPLNSDIIFGYFLQNDIHNTPAYIIRITEKRLLYQQGKTTIAYLIAVLLLSSTIFCAVMLLFIRSSVLQRISRLKDSVFDISRNQDISRRLEVQGHDELTHLAASINTMLDSLESWEKLLQDSEERYRTLFERAPDSILIISTEGSDAGKIVAANTFASLQHGYSVEELCSMKIYDLNTPETNLIAGPMMDRILKGEWVVQEMWHRRKDGTSFPLEANAGLIKINGAKYILGFDRDITARKKAEEADRTFLDQIKNLNDDLNAQAHELQAANEELESFNYSVSHDMRGPLTRISGYCQILQDDEGMLPDQQEYLNKIIESAEWMDEMLDALLALSRVLRAEMKPQSVNISSLADSIIHELQTIEPERNVSVFIRPSMVVSGDPRLLKVMLTNLLNNAWKYTGAREKGLIEFDVLESPEEPALFFVRDNGDGFSMSEADRLFRAFSRLHGGTQFKGTGVGLATVRRIVTRHGGKIWAEAEPGRGATFYFTLAQPETENQRTVSWPLRLAAPQP